MTKRIDVREIAATGTRDATTYLRGDGTWIAPGGAVLTTEDVQDIVGAMVVAGSNVTATYDDAAGTLTLASTGGGAGSLTVQDENGTVATGVTQIDFQGAGVTAAPGTGEVVVTIPGGGSGGGGSGTSLVKAKTAAATNSTSTLADDPDLQFTVGPGETWVVDAWLRLTCASATVDANVDLTGTGTITGTQDVVGVTTSATSIESTARFVSTGINTTGVTMGVVATGTHPSTPVQLHAVISGGASGGTAKIRFAQTVASGTNPLSLLAGSSLTATKV